MSWRKKAELDKTDDRRAYKIVKKHTDLRCSICPPHRHENACRHAKHGPQKPRYKNKRSRK